MSLVIVDYGVGNLASIQNILKRVGVEALISSDTDSLLAAQKIILPGVGAFDTCARQLHQSGLMPALQQRVLHDEVPVLGICVGMQLMLEGSEEGTLPGLGWIKGRNLKFDQTILPAGYKIPHMGWTDVQPINASKLLEDIVDPRFYFVHSYHAQLTNETDGNIVATYGYSFVAGVARKNIVGVQFHPEKSHAFGMKLFQNFVSRY